MHVVAAAELVALIVAAVAGGRDGHKIAVEFARPVEAGVFARLDSCFATPGVLRCLAFSP